MIDALKRYSSLIDKSGLLEFSYLIKPEEYTELLALRFHAYQLAHKLKYDAMPHDLSDVFDTQSKIILAKYNKKIIGSIRFTFIESYHHSLFCQYLPDQHTYFKLSEICEGSRLCIHASMQGKHLAYQLDALVILTAHYFGKRYMLGSAAGWTIDFHQRCGFKPLGIRYPNPDFINIPHELVLADINAVIRGIGIREDIYQQFFMPAIEAFS